MTEMIQMVVFVVNQMNNFLKRYVASERPDSRFEQHRRSCPDVFCGPFRSPQALFFLGSSLPTRHRRQQCDLVFSFELWFQFFAVDCLRFAVEGRCVTVLHLNSVCLHATTHPLTLSTVGWASTGF